jgi:hypothetical protein
MRKPPLLMIGAFVAFAPVIQAQQGTSSVPDAPTPQTAAPAPLHYTPPIQGERLRLYVKSTYGLASIIEAGVRGGLDQALDRPNQWPEGGQGYADRFGSAMGEIAVLDTTEYVAADLFREDLRRTPCRSPCAHSAFMRALQDTFTAKKGQDGHPSISVARLAGPITASAVAKEAWYPSGYPDSEIAKDAGANYLSQFVRNLIWELRH